VNPSILPAAPPSKPLSNSVAIPKIISMDGEGPNEASRLLIRLKTPLKETSAAAARLCRRVISSLTSWRVTVGDIAENRDIHRKSSLYLPLGSVNLVLKAQSPECPAPEDVGTEGHSKARGTSKFGCSHDLDVPSIWMFP